MWILLPLLFGLPLSAHADPNAMIWTQDGYRILAMNDEGRGLLLSQAVKEKDGLIVSVGAQYTLLDENAGSVWSRVAEGDGADKLEQALAVEGEGWIAVGSSASGDMDNGWHEGWYEEFEAKTDGWVVRVDRDGEILWNHCYGGTDWDSFKSICPAWDGGWIAVGETYSMDGDVSGLHGVEEAFVESDAWAVHIGENGDILWQKSLGGTESDAFFGVSPAPGGYLAVGRTNSSDGDVSGALGNLDGWVVRMDLEGNILRQACYGGEEEDQLTALAQGNGGWLAAGRTWSRLPDGRGSDAWVVGLDENGETLFGGQFGNEKQNLASYAVWVDEFWAVAGVTQETERPPEWIVAVQPDGSAWKLIRGEF